MGKNSDRESLIRLLANTLVHEILAKHTNRPESRHFLSSEIAEYRGQTEKAAENYNWNDEDRNFIKEKALQKVKEKLFNKYPDVNYSEEEVMLMLDKMIKEIM